MPISDIVVVNIDRATKVPSRAGFGTPLIVGPNAAFSEKVRSYSSIEAVTTDFNSSTAEHKAASKIFSQSPKVSKVLIGKRAANVAQVRTVTVGTLANNTLYRVTINGVNFDYTSDADATTEEIEAGLTLAVNGGAEPVTAVNGTGVVLTADVPGDAFTLATSANLTVANTAENKNVADELAAISLVNNDWYALVLTSHTEQDILHAAAYVEARVKIYGAASSDSGILSGSSTSVLAKLKDLGYDRTFVVYHADPDNIFPEAGWIGKALPSDPGSITWKFKSASGVTPSDDLNDTQVSNIRAENGNVYQTVAGIPMFSEGIMVSGEFIDIIHGTDLIQARIQESVFGLLVNEGKVPFTNAGIDAVKLAIQAPLNNAVTLGILAADPAPEVTAPDVSAISANDKAARFLDQVEFTGTYAGAIHKTRIQGTLSV